MQRVKFDHKSTSVHGLWDGLMIDKVVAGNYGGCKDCFVKSLVEKIRGEWLSEQQQWLSCQPLDLKESNETAPICPLNWATVGNKLNWYVFEFSHSFEVNRYGLD